MMLAAGTTLHGRYTLGAPIASGGMGDVWEATDEVLQRPVAVKVLRPADPDDATFVERFRDEARGSAALHHPNIAAMYDYGEEDELAFLVMELVPGRTLGELIRESDGGLEPDRVRSLLGQAALALAAAHEAGVVHRDVKPANIIVTPEGQAKLTDFGIARIGDGSGHTRVGEVLGTPDYISPEQALGEPATAASDIYSLGVVAHEMLTGHKPFESGTPVATALAQVNDPPPALPETVPADLRDVVDACLAKRPEQRPASAGDLAAAVGVPLGALPGVTPRPSSDARTELIATPSAATTPLAASAGAATGGAASAGDVAPTRAMPVTGAAVPGRGAATPTSTPTSKPTSTVDGPRAVSSRWAWAAVPLVALVAVVAFALGGRMSSPDAARSSSPSTSAGASSSAASSGTSGAASTSTTTTPPTSTSSTTTSPSAPDPAPPAPGEGKGNGKGDGKGDGKGKGKGN